MKKAVVIVAGGSGTRMQSSVPKQFMLLNGKPILMHTIERFYNYNKQIVIVVVLPKNEIDKWSQLCQEFSFSILHRVAAGGETRFHSVKNGLSLIEEDCTVAVHDGVRPLVLAAVIDRCFVEASKGKAVIPVIPAIDSLRMVTSEGNKALDRSSIKLVQTPQVFPIQMLKKAYEQGYQPFFTDDASVVEFDGQTITLVDGNVENIKITTPIDLITAEKVFDKVI